MRTNRGLAFGVLEHFHGPATSDSIKRLAIDCQEAVAGSKPTEVSRAIFKERVDVDGGVYNVEQGRWSMSDSQFNILQGLAPSAKAQHLPGDLATDRGTSAEKTRDAPGDAITVYEN